MSSMFIEDIMPLITDQDDYLKYYIDESLPLFDKINIIIKKGNSMQRQALINNLNSYVHDSLFANLIQFIITDIGTWEVESINLFPKSLYYIIINNKLDNELFNTIFKHIIINITTGADQTREEYTIYFDKIIEYYRPTKTSYEIYNNIIININKEFPYVLNDNIFETILSLGVFGQSKINRRLCGYLSSSLCRLLIKKDKSGNKNNNTSIQDKNVQKMYTRLCSLFDDPEKEIELQMVRELQYLLPLFKDIIFNEEEVIKAIGFYINTDWDNVPQSMAIICLLNNIMLIENQKKLVDDLIEKIKEVIEEKTYEINFKNDIMDCLIHCLYNHYKNIPSVVYKVSDLGIIEYYVNKLFSKETMNICIQNFDKIFFLVNNVDETYNCYSESVSELNNNTNLTNTGITNLSNICTSSSNIIINKNLMNSFCQIDEGKSHNNKIYFEELFVNIYNKLFNQVELTESSNSNLISLSKTESNESKINDIYEENKRLFFKYLSNILRCIFPFPKMNKQITDIVFDIFKKENILNVLGYYCNEKNEYEKFDKKKKNKFYKLLHFFIKNNYKKYMYNLNININNSNNNINAYYNKEFVFDNNIYNKLFLLILNNIICSMDELQKSSNNNLCLLVANSLNLLIPKIFKFYKNVVIIPHNANNVNYIITNNTVKENNVDNRTFYLEKIYEDIFSKIISVIILNKSIGFFVKKEFVKILPLLILYSFNRNKYLEFTRKEIIKSNNFFMRKFSLIFIQTCLEKYSFEFFKRLNIYDDMLDLMKDEVNIISTGIINIIHENIKKIMAYSDELFENLCEQINEVYNSNVQKFNQDAKNFDEEKNIIINKILNIKELNKSNQYFQSDELEEIKDYENKLFTIENGIINFGINFHKLKRKSNDSTDNNKSSHEVTHSIFQRISSTSTTFQSLKNNINASYISNNNIFNQNNHNTFKTQTRPVKKNSLTNGGSDLIKNLISKNISNYKHYLPKIQVKRKSSNFNPNIANNINPNNGNDNMYVIKSNNNCNNNCQLIKSPVSTKEKLPKKNKKLNPFPKNRTPSAKTLKKNKSPNNNTCEDSGFKVMINKKSVSNKNINLFIKQNNKNNTISLQKDYNNLFLQGSNKIYINAAEKINTSITSSK